MTRAAVGAPPLVAVEQPPGGAVEPLHLDQHAQERGSATLAAWAKIPPSPLAPAYSSPQPSHRTDMLMSVGWVSTPSSPKRRSRLGYVLRLCTMKPLSIGHDAPVGGHDVVGVRVPAETGLRLVEGDVALALQHVGGGEPGHPGADDRDPPAPEVATEFRRALMRSPGRCTSRHRAARAMSSGRSNGASSAMAATNAAVIRCQSDARASIPCPLHGTWRHTARRANGSARVDEPRRRTRAGGEVAGAVQHHEVAAGELLDRLGAGEPWREGHHAAHGRMPGGDRSAARPPIE